MSNLLFRCCRRAVSIASWFETHTRIHSIHRSGGEKTPECPKVKQDLSHLNLRKKRILFILRSRLSSIFGAAASMRWNLTSNPSWSKSILCVYVLHVKMPSCLLIDKRVYTWRYDSAYVCIHVRIYNNQRMFSFLYFGYNCHSEFGASKLAIYLTKHTYIPPCFYDLTHIRIQTWYTKKAGIFSSSALYAKHYLIIV